MAEEEPEPKPHKDRAKMTEEDHKHLADDQKPAKAGGERRYFPRYTIREPRRTFSAFLVTLLVLLAIALLIVWLIYRPHRPRFRVVNVAVYDINVNSPPYLYTTMQFTVVIRNPNKRNPIYYDHMSAYVSYRNQPITPPIMLPPLYHETKSTVAMSPILGGAAVPVPPEVANGFIIDEGYGVVGLRLVIMGRLRYKAGAIRTRHYRIYVTCDVFVGLRNGVVGQVPLLGSSQCNVDV